MTPEQGIAQVRAGFSRAWLRVPLLVGNEAVNFSLDNFRLQGFQGASFIKWPARKVGWVKDKRPGRALLIKTDALWRSIRIVRLTSEGVTVGSDVKYARAHNEGYRMGHIQTVKAHTRRVTGIVSVSSIATRKTRSQRAAIGTQTVSAHTRRVDVRIPRRQFMGNSPYLDARIKRVVTLACIREIKTLQP